MDANNYKTKQHLFWLPLIVLLLTTSCNTGKVESLAMVKPDYKEDRNVVVTTLAREGDFYKEYENNGILEAGRKASLTMKEIGMIEKVLVKNGDRVKQGQLLATIEDDQLQYAYDRADRNLEKTLLELATLLIEQGYTLADSANIPEDVWKRAMIKSGQQDAINEKTMAATRLSDTRIVAPFSGIVADLEARPYNRSDQFKQFCLMIDDSWFQVEFSVLESEFDDMAEGMSIEVRPFAYNDYRVMGILSSINPKVEENGMIKVRANIPNKEGKLAEGMNVKILAKKSLGKLIYVPKEAVTLRQERNVVFTHRSDTVFWNYVETGPTNSKFTAISTGIIAGDEVVIEGHFNLGHLAIVEVIDQK